MKTPTIRGDFSALAAATNFFRSEQGWSAAELAEQMNMVVQNRNSASHPTFDYDYVYRIENSAFKRPSKVSSLIDIVSEVFDVDRSDIVDFDSRTIVLGKAIHRDLIAIGKTKTLWASRFGHSFNIEFEKIKCLSSDKFIDMPAEFVPIQTEEISKVAADPKRFDGTQFALLNVHEYRRDDREDSIDIDFGLNKYSGYQAITANPKGIFRKYDYLKRWSITDAPIPFLSQGVGIHAAVVTNDQKLIFVIRAMRGGVGVRSGELDIGVVEGLSKHLDQNKTIESGHFDLKNVFIRSAAEEFGIQAEDIAEIRLFGLGYDLQYTQWNFTGRITLNISASEVIENRFPKYAKTKNEFESVFSIPAELNIVLDYIYDKTIWSSGIAVIDHVFREKTNNVTKYEKTIEKFSMKIDSQYKLRRSFSLAPPS
jgi:hypothetical protein